MSAVAVIEFSIEEDGKPRQAIKLTSWPLYSDIEIEKVRELGFESLRTFQDHMADIKRSEVVSGRDAEHREQSSSTETAKDERSHTPS